jgi:spermidine/putrescine transport system substrate-binding protein
MGEQGMRRRDFLRAGAGVAAGAFAAGCGVGPQEAPPAVVQPVVAPKIDGDLLIFNWTEYMNPKVIKRFEKHYGVGVTVSNFDSMPSMMAKLQAGNRYDLIFPTADYVNRLNRRNALRPLDRAALKNAGGIYPFFDDPWYDKDSAHTVPYGMYTTGIAWREDKVGDLTGSWGDLANEQAKGRIFMLDDFQESIGQANLFNGFDLNTTVAEELEQSKETLQFEKEFLRGYSTNPAPNLVSGTAWIHHAWNGDVVNARNQSKHPEQLRYQTCKEGIPVGSDCMAIPSNARHPGTATLFIDWMLDPENAAANVSWFGYPMPIKGTEDAFAELASDDPAIEITTDDLAKGAQFRELDKDAKKAWDRIWTEVKA